MTSNRAVIFYKDDDLGTVQVIESQTISLESAPSSIIDPSRWLTAFVCDADFFEFRRLPYGLKPASNTFIRCISRILHPIRSFKEPFVDDMAVFSMTSQDHLKDLEKYFHTTKESGLTLSPEKCSFEQITAIFVGNSVLSRPVRGNFTPKT